MVLNGAKYIILGEEKKIILFSPKIARIRESNDFYFILFCGKQNYLASQTYLIKNKWKNLLEH